MQIQERMPKRMYVSALVDRGIETRAILLTIQLKDALLERETSEWSVDD